MAIPGVFRGLEAGTLGNPLDYDPPPVAASTTLTAATVDSLVDGAMTPSSPAAGGSFTVDSATGFPAPPASTLAADIEPGDDTADLVDASTFATAGVFKVGSERISYESKAGNSLGELRRGAMGTTEEALHSSAAAVRQAAVAVVESEPIAYHTLAGAVLGDILREAPVDHADNAVCAVSADVDVTAVTGFSIPGRVQIGAEVIAYTSIATLALQGVSRGVDGTAVEAHAMSADVDSLAYPKLDALINSGRQKVRPLFLPNADTVPLAVGALVSWEGLPAAGGGVVAVVEGGGAIGLLSQATEVGAWGRVRSVGIASLLLDAVTPELPGPGEPVFAKSSTTLKSLENADSGDVAVGRCLRVHAFDYDGVTALATSRVDFVLISQIVEPYIETAAQTLPIKTVTTTYTVASTDGVILADSSGGAFTVTLPPVSGLTGRVFHVKQIEDNQGVTVDGDGAETIDGGLTAVLLSEDEAITIICDGTTWRILAA